ncbi:unnamed protein product [Didymodactylos carnosus]|uniref:Glycoside hydrolase family 2 catalytic domain-containing protein n=1 Tax=Didymodactylos carnosus TaxID=1234261 RepID=A0A814T1I8_9BILA|nr:unnamed protein product [Didymodactylos carnosus]CAF1154700.1 unnamed protein product [Didymodactylos carnosus]CAF3663297.1 unnamed protein product [Didymodactylos carnosus]CAF3918129.1 unnamed protein product [Didymodactylos carnosus]
MPPRVQRRDVIILKELGCNIVRCSHYPQHTAFLEACDELGLLVYEEAPGWGYIGDATWQDLVVRDVQQMVLRDRNHPSILLWGVRLNETPNNKNLYTRTQLMAKSLDDSRNTSGAIAGPDYGITDFQQDVFAFNDYYTQLINGTKFPRLKPPRTEWPFVLTEAVGAISGPSRTYRRFDPVFDQQAQSVAHGMVHSQAAADPRYCGVVSWCGFDYPSAAGTDGVKYPGVVNEFRVPKLGAAMYAAQINPKQRIVIEPAFYWYFNGTQSVSTLGSQALIWSNADKLELFIAEKHFATLSPSTDLFGNLSYPPFIADFTAAIIDANTSLPDLRIDSYAASGQKLGSRLFSSNTSTDRFSMSVDDEILFADGADSTRVMFQVVDNYGVPRPSLYGYVQFQLTGPARIIGDNPFPIGATGGVGAIWIRTQLGLTGNVTVVGTHSSLGSVGKNISVLASPS